MLTSIILLVVAIILVTVGPWASARLEAKGRQRCAEFVMDVSAFGFVVAIFSVLFLNRS